MKKKKLRASVYKDAAARIEEERSEFSCNAVELIAGYDGLHSEAYAALFCKDPVHPRAAFFCSQEDAKPGTDYSDDANVALRAFDKSVRLTALLLMAEMVKHGDV